MPEIFKEKFHIELTYYHSPGSVDCLSLCALSVLVACPSTSLTLGYTEPVVFEDDPKEYHVND